MARTRTLTLLRDDVRRVADIRNSTTRHPDGDIDRLINQAVQELREIASVNGHGLYTTIAALTTTAGVGAVSIASLTSFLRLLALDVIVDGKARTVDEFSLRERNDSGGLGATAFAAPDAERGVPRTFRLVRDTIALLPVPDAAYALNLWYLPAHTDMASGSDTFDGQAGWEDYVVWHAAAQIGLRDKNATLVQLANAERAKIEQRIVATAPKRYNATVGRRIDTRGRRRAGRRYA